MTAVWVIAGLTAWFSATISPILTFRLFRRLGRRTGSSWLAHLLFAPAVVGVWWVSAYCFTLANGDQERGPDERGLGILLLPSMVVLLIVIVLDYGGLARAAWKRFKSPRQNVR